MDQFRWPGLEFTTSLGLFWRSPLIATKEIDFAHFAPESDNWKELLLPPCSLMTLCMEERFLHRHLWCFCCRCFGVSKPELQLFARKPRINSMNVRNYKLLPFFVAWTRLTRANLSGCCGSGEVEEEVVAEEPVQRSLCNELGGRHSLYTCASVAMASRDLTSAEVE